MTALTTSPRLTLPPGMASLDSRHDDVADAGVAPRRATENTDAQDLLGARVVGNLQPRFLLNHSISSTWVLDERQAPTSGGHNTRDLTYAVLLLLKGTQGLPEGRPRSAQGNQ